MTLQPTTPSTGGGPDPRTEQPALAAGVVTAVTIVLGACGVTLATGDVQFLGALVCAVLTLAQAVWTRRKVVPVAKHERVVADVQAIAQADRSSESEPAGGGDLDEAGELDAAGAAEGDDPLAGLGADDSGDAYEPRHAGESLEGGQG